MTDPWIYEVSWLVTKVVIIGIVQIAGVFNCQVNLDKFKAGIIEVLLMSNIQLVNTIFHSELSLRFIIHKVNKWLEWVNFQLDDWYRSCINWVAVNNPTLLCQNCIDALKYINNFHSRLVFKSCNFNIYVTRWNSQSSSIWSI